jgi:hypothetical protein
MPSAMKIKFAGFLRGLLRQLDNHQSARPVAPPAPPAAAAGSASPLSAESIGKNSAPPGPASSSEIQIPLTSVITALPMDLKAKLMTPPPAGQTICVSVETIISQLAFGAVKISFGQLRALAPGLFANSGGEHDSRPINLPLHEILSRINPALLSRRPVQKVEVNDEVAGPFGGRGRGVTFTTHPLKPVTTPLPVADLNQPVPFTPPSAPMAMPPAPRVVTPASPSNTEVFSFTPRQVAPATPPIPFNPPAKPAGNGNGNGNAHVNGNGNGNGHASLPPFKFNAAPVSPATPSSAPRPEAAQPPLLVSLDDLAESWPAEVRNEILRSNLANASVPLPANIVEPGLKRGRVKMTWKELRTLTRPSSAPSPNDGLELELPLKILAPAFLSAQKFSTRSQQKVLVPDEIPNLFFGFPGSTEAAAPPAPVPVAPRPADTNFYVWGENGEMPQTEEKNLKRIASPATDFTSRHTHPQEIVARAMALAGVAGAVVALADGLRVASEVPAALNADAVAAFLPQIYERVNQSTRELRMGALNNVGFTVGNAPWKIFRVNSIYFAAFGRAGESLPKSQLAALAVELDRKRPQ